MTVLVIAQAMPILPVLLAGLPAVARGVIASVALAAGLSALLALKSKLCQTTLRSAWWWAAAALVAWSGAELIAAAATQSGWAKARVSPLRVAAIVVSLCPVVAVLGAKRPQDRAWNFVVLSLYAIIALPAAEGLFLHPAQRVEMGGARGWFLWILILLGPINYVPTRYWLAALALAAGQVVALSPYLALVRRELMPQAALVGQCLASAATVAAACVSRRPSRAAHALDRQWLDFRDAFGLLWALRVQERLNAAARQHGWNRELAWSGFLGSQNSQSGVPKTEVPEPVEPALRTSFRALLRRFVSSQWMDDRSTVDGNA